MMGRRFLLFLVCLVVSLAINVGPLYAQEKPEVFVQLGHSSHVTSVSFSPDGRYIVSGSDDDTIKLWEVSTGREIRTLTGHSEWVKSVSFSPDGKYIVSGSWDKTIKLWEVSTGREVAMFVGFTDGEWVVITPEGYYNASPKRDKHLNVRIGNKVYGIENYRKTFYRPDIVKLALAGRSLKK